MRYLYIVAALLLPVVAEAQVEKLFPATPEVFVTDAAIAQESEIAALKAEVTEGAKAIIRVCRATEEKMARLEAKNARLRAALTEIAEGPYRHDPLLHAEQVVWANIGTARRALSEEPAP